MIDETFECAVIGAGPAGLGAAAMLRKRGVQAVILERAEGLAESWRNRYDGFRLNTSSWFSYLPGQRLPRAAGRWPSRDSLVAYYEDYARRNELDIRLGINVVRIDHAGPGWSLDADGRRVAANTVVVATGKYHTPAIPDWPGKDDFDGRLLHSIEYRNAEPFRGARALVVGPGASGFEIATQLAHGDADQVWLSIRTPPHIVHRDVGPFPSDLFAVLGRRLPIGLVDRAGDVIRRLTIGDQSEHGLFPPPDGIYTRVKTSGMVPTVDGPYLDVVKRRLVTIVPAVERIEPNGVLLEGNRRVNADLVVVATGYRRNLEPLVGHLGVLDDTGHPLAHGPRTHPSAPRLYFTGFTEPFSGNLRELRLDARRIAGAISADRTA